MIKHPKQKRLLAILLVFLFLVSTHILVFGSIKVQGVSIVDSIESPGVLPTGLTWDGKYLWSSDSFDKRIYKLDPSTGAIVDSIPSPGSDPSGLAWHADCLWNADSDDKTIYKLDPSNGDVIDSYRSPGNFPEGLAWDGDYLWNADSGDNTIYKLNPKKFGSGVVDSIPSPGDDPTGLAWDGDYLWNADSNDKTIYKLDPSNGRVVESLDILENLNVYLEGLTYSGHYLWSSDSNKAIIYKIDVRASAAPFVEITSISCPDEVSTNQLFTIEVTIKNNWYSAAKNVTATIDLPSGFSLTSSSIEIPIGSILAGENKTVNWTAKASEPGDVVITVRISSTNCGSDSITETMHVNPGFVYMVTKATFVGLPSFVWIILMFAGIGIGLGVVQKKRGRAIIPKSVPFIGTPKALSLKRGYETAGQYVKVGIKVENFFPTTITDVSVKIDVSSALEKVNPKTGIVELGIIKPNSSQSANFQLTPIRCVDDNVNAIIMFRDASGKLFTQEMKPLELRSICPMLTGEDVDQERILMTLRNGLLKKNKSSFKFKGDPRTAFIMAEARIKGLIPVDKDEKFMEDTYIACGCYIGRTKYGEFDFAAEIIVSGKQNEGLLTIAVYSNEEAILSGFFYEILDDVKKHIEITRETIEVAEQACPECGGQLDLGKTDDERYLKCDFCETLLRLPPWKK